MPVDEVVLPHSRVRLEPSRRRGRRRRGRSPLSAAYAILCLAWFARGLTWLLTGHIWALIILPFWLVAYLGWQRVHNQQRWFERNDLATPGPDPGEWLLLAVNYGLFALVVLWLP